MNDLKNIDKLEMVGELLLDLSSQASEGRVITVRSDDERLEGISISEIENLIAELSQDSGLLNGYEKYMDEYHITRFEMVINSMELRDYLMDTYGKSQTKSIPELQEEYLDKQVLYWLDFHNNGYIILNDKYQMAKMDYGSNSYEVFLFLFKNERKEITKEKIEKAKKIEITRDMSKTFDEIGFKKQLKKLFLKSSKKKILLRRKVTRGEMKKLRIDEELLKTQINELKIYQR